MLGQYGGLLLVFGGITGAYLAVELMLWIVRAVWSLVGWLL
jgi:hypothetical protein